MSKIRSIETLNPEQYPVRCPGCRKTPRNCVCYEFRMGSINGTACVFVDQVATDPVRGEITGTWQARRNAKIWRRPKFLDGYGPILFITDESLRDEVKAAILDGSFSLLDYYEREGCRVKNFERNLVRRFPFLRTPRKTRIKQAA